MGRRTRIPDPPPTITDPATIDYFRQIADAINQQTAPDPSYGGFYEEEGTPELAIGTAPVLYNRWSSKETGTPDVVANNSTGIINVYSWGTYKVGFQSSFTASANQVIDFYVYLNGANTDVGCHRSSSAGGIGSASISPFAFSINSGDSISIYVNAEQASKKITNVDGQFNVWRID